MRKLLPVLALISLLSTLAFAEDTSHKKIMIFPFKKVEKGKEKGTSKELAHVLGTEISKQGDFRAISGEPFASAIQGRVDPARLARMANRMELYGVVWGTLAQTPDGYLLEVSLVGKDPKGKFKKFSVSGKDMEQLLSEMKGLAGRISIGAATKPKIGKITIDGNERIGKEAILNKLDMKPGTPFDKSHVGDEIREIFSMGYFDDVRIRAEETADGQVDLQIVLKERPYTKEIEIEGNKVFSADAIKDKLMTKTYTPASVDKIRSDIEKIKEMYEKEGYYEPQVDYDIKELSRTEAKLIYRIKEGQKSFLTELVFEGRERIPEKELRGVINLKEKSWIWFLDESGTFTREKLEQSRQRLLGYYSNKGFIKAQAGAPKIEISGRKVKITYPIREGERYQVRKIDIEGDLIMPAEKLKEHLKSKPRSYFEAGAMMEDIKTLTKLYNNLGYAYADIEPSQNINDEHYYLDVTYKITKGQRVSIEKVDISGNERTRDKVIRRRLAVNEGDLYSADALDFSKKGLEALDFFEAVKLKTSPGTRPDLMNVRVDLLEKKTGQLSAGLGFSSQEGAMANINLKERNLLGLGIAANLKADISGRRSTYEGSLTYPYPFDIPVNVSARGYNTITNETYYTRKSDGFGLFGAYPIYGAWNLSTGFSRDASKLSGFRPGFARSIQQYYQRFGITGEKYLDLAENALSISLNRDTRNSSMIPTSGSNISFGTRLSGFGADVAFSRYFWEGTYYQPLYWGAILKLRTNASGLLEWENQPIPFDRRILLGGIASIRGYQFGEIGPVDQFGSIIGGDRGVFANIECLVPVVQSLNLNGVAFFDVGNAWNVDQSQLPKDVKAGVGVGVRWMSPMGPIRLEYGWKVSPKKGEAPGAFAFAMGQLF